MSTICDDLRAAILQAAMQGRLTKQLPEDGNAKDLLEKIKTEKEKLISGGKIKKQKPLAPITDDEIPFSIPENWQWVRMADLFTIVTGKKDANFGSDSGEYRFFTCAKVPIYSNSYSFSGEVDGAVISSPGFLGFSMSQLRQNSAAPCINGNATWRR